MGPFMPQTSRVISLETVAARAGTKQQQRCAEHTQPEKYESNVGVG